MLANFLGLLAGFSSPLHSLTVCVMFRAQACSLNHLGKSPDLSDDLPIFKIEIIIPYFNKSKMPSIMRRATVVCATKEKKLLPIQL